MKRLIFVLFLLGSIFSQAQDDNSILKVTYTYHPLFSPLGDYDVHLYIDKKSSQYISHQKEEEYTTEENYIVTPFFIKYTNNYYFDSKKVEESRTLKDSTNLYAEWQNDIQWNITNEEKIINGYKVKKAITKTFDVSEDDDDYPGNTIAWFAPNIPIPTGPARYYGLPGLVLEVSYEKSRDRYTLKSIEKIPATEYSFQSIDKTNKVEEKEDVIYLFHKNPKKIKALKKKKK